MLAKALEWDNKSKEETVSPGTFARLYIKDVPQAVASTLYSRAKMIPIIVCGLLQHESKMSVLHFRYLVLPGLLFILIFFTICD